MTMKSNVRSRALTIGTAAVLLFSETAGAAGLSQATSVLNTLKQNLTSVIPVFATVALMLVGALYAARMIHKDTFIHWFIGILVAGSASELTAMIFG
jgi:hypothetical protein